jgi:hypothetical protein
MKQSGESNGICPWCVHTLKTDETPDMPSYPTFYFCKQFILLWAWHSTRNALAFLHKQNIYRKNLNKWQAAAVCFKNWCLIEHTERERERESRTLLPLSNDSSFMNRTSGVMRKLIRLPNPMRTYLAFAFSPSSAMSCSLSSPYTDIKTFATCR